MFRPILFCALVFLVVGEVELQEDIEDSYLITDPNKVRILLFGSSERELAPGRTLKLLKNLKSSLDDEEPLIITAKRSEAGNNKIVKNIKNFLKLNPNRGSPKVVTSSLKERAKVAQLLGVSEMSESHCSEDYYNEIDLLVEEYALLKGTIVPYLTECRKALYEQCTEMGKAPNESRLALIQHSNEESETDATEEVSH